MIEFACPNGHRLKSPDDRAGKRDKCPKCGVEVAIPSAALSGGHGASGGGAEPRGDTIVFFCPQGHKLNGPATLRGKPGKCPHCGERFQIPRSDEPAMELPSTWKAGSPATAEPTGPFFSDLAADELPTAEARATPEPADDEEFNEFAEITEYDDEEPVDGEPLEDDDPYADERHEHVEPAYEPVGALERHLFERLWEEKQHGATLRVRLRSGDVFEPEWYAPTSSHHGHAVFAHRTEGKVAVVTVAWEAIERIDVGPLDTLPDWGFE